MARDPWSRLEDVRRRTRRLRARAITVLRAAPAFVARVARSRTAAVVVVIAAVATLVAPIWEPRAVDASSEGAAPIFFTAVDPDAWRGSAGGSVRVEVRGRPTVASRLHAGDPAFGILVQMSAVVKPEHADNDLRMRVTLPPRATKVIHAGFDSPPGPIDVRGQQSVDVSPTFRIRSSDASATSILVRFSFFVLVENLTVRHASVNGLPANVNHLVWNPDGLTWHGPSYYTETLDGEPTFDVAEVTQFDWDELLADENPTSPAVHFGLCSSCMKVEVYAGAKNTDEGTFFAEEYDPSAPIVQRWSSPDDPWSSPRRAGALAWTTLAGAVLLWAFKAARGSRSSPTPVASPDDERLRHPAEDAHAD